MSKSWSRKYYLFFIALLFSNTQVAFGAIQWEIQELAAFTSSKSYAWNQFPLQVTFIHQETGKRFTVDGYADGSNSSNNSLWKVRFTLPLTGIWNWSSSSGSGDIGLINRTGTISVSAPSPNLVNGNRNYRGHIKVGPTRRYFVHADGTPFFYLGDTLWTINSTAAGVGSVNNNFLTWVNDRKNKKFTVAQVATYTEVANEGGYAFNNSNWNNLNTAFFQWSDVRFAYLWRQGFIIAMHPTWITTESIVLNQAINMSRYVMARYGAYNLVWSLTGEYGLDNATTHWTANNFANIRALGNAVMAFNKYSHPMSIHPAGYDLGLPDDGVQSSHFDFHNEPWLDHNWLQTYGSNQNVPFRVQQAYNANPIKPVIESEPCYEDRVYGGSFETCTPSVVRRQAWVALLNGAAGHVYGHDSLYFMQDISRIHAPGSSHMTKLIDFFMSRDWWRLEPIGCLTINGSAPNLLTKTHPHCGGRTGDTFVVYFPIGSIGLSGVEVTKLGNIKYFARWYNPQTGAYINISEVNTDLDDRWTVPNRPSSEDWILVLTRTGGSSQSPYLGNPAAIPGTIEAENFDLGDDGIAYHDSDVVNNAGNIYRTSAVEVISNSTTEGGFAIGWTRPGEWLEYTVNVVTAGFYKLEARVASNGSGGSFHVEFADMDKTGLLTVPNTGGWQNWTTISKTGIYLNAGVQIMRIHEDTAGISNSIGNINWLRLTPESSGQTPYLGNPAAIPGTIEAENFDLGGEGVAYHDSDVANNAGNIYRTSAVEVISNSTSEGGFAIGWTRPGEWLEYTVNVVTAGFYKLEARVASNGPGGTFYVAFDETDKTGLLTVPNTGGWQNWTTISKAGIYLNAGNQVMRIYENTSAGTPGQSVGNINWLKFTSELPAPLAHWKLDEGNGFFAYDSSSNNHPGTLVNGPVWEASGIRNGALRLDGVDDHVGIDDSIIKNRNSFSLVAWVKVTSTQKGVVYGEENTPNKIPFVYISINENATGDAEFGIRDDTNVWGGISTSPLNLNDGRWHQLVGVQRSKSDREFFVDGISRGQSSQTVGTVTVTKAHIGKFDVSTTYNRLLGSVDDIRIYDRALTRNEIQTLYNGQ